MKSTPSRWAVGVAALAYGASRALRARRAIALAGKSVAIFGGSRGLGLVVAQEMARQGARLGLFARNAEELAVAVDMVRTYGGEVFGHVCDVRDRAQVDVAIARQADVYGGVDVLINDAGIIQVGPFEHMRTRTSKTR